MTETRQANQEWSMDFVMDALANGTLDSCTDGSWSVLNLR